MKLKRDSRLFQFVETRDGRYDAWTKAPSDVMAILAEMGFKNLYIQAPDELGRGVIRRTFSRGLRTLRLLSLLFLPRYSVFVLQFPQRAFDSEKLLSIFELLRKHKKCQFIALIHDLPKYNKISDPAKYQFPEKFKRLLGLCNCIIVHNESMRDLFLKRNIQDEKLFVLGVFDYLEKGSANKPAPKLSNHVAIAGNLILAKGGYLSQLRNVEGVQWNFYGSNYEEEKCSGTNVTYHGSFPPDVLPGMLKGSFGLIWDGPVLDQCGGLFGAYLKINSPHKLSLYIASGMPVIIWSQAAQSDFVKWNGIGLVVDAITDIPSLIHQMRPDDYLTMVKNVQSLCVRLRNGEFTKNAIGQCLSSIGVQA